MNRPPANPVRRPVRRGLRARFLLLATLVCCGGPACAQWSNIRFDGPLPATEPSSRPTGWVPFGPSANPAERPSSVREDPHGPPASGRSMPSTYDSGSVSRRTSVARDRRRVEYDLPTLWVRGGGGGGGCSRSKFRLSRDGTGPLRVAASDDTPGGSAPESRASLWQAAMTAAFLRNDPLTGVRVEYEYSGLNGGPSAGAVFCLAILSALDGRAFPGDFAMTGTIMPDGTIGLVGGVAQKLEGAKAAGIRRVCIPAFARFETEDDGSLVDLVARGRDLGLELHLVSNVEEAYAILHGLPVPAAEHLADAEVYAEPPAQENALFGAIIRNGRQAASIREELAKITEDPDVAEVMAGVTETMKTLFGIPDMDIALGAGMLHLALHQSSEELAVWSGVAQLAGRIAEIGDQYDLDTVEGYRQWDSDLQDRFEGIGQKAALLEMEWIEEMRFRGADGALTAQCVSVNWFSDVINLKLRLNQERLPTQREIDEGEDKEVVLGNLLKEMFCARFEKFFEIENSAWRSLAATLPQRAPNRSVGEVEGLFWAAQKALADTLDQEFAEESSALVDADEDWSLYLLKRKEASAYHRQALELQEKDDPGAHFAMLMSAMAQADTLAHGFMARTIASPESKARYDSDEGSVIQQNHTFLSYLLRTARVQAVRSLLDCTQRRIPCPRVRYHVERGDFYRDEGSHDRLDVLREYWCATLQAKVLRLVY